MNMTGAAFLAFLAVVVAIALLLVARYMNRRIAFRVAAGLFVWFVYTGVLGYSGVFRNTALRPPGVAFLFLPLLVLLAFFLLRCYSHPEIAQAFPLWLLLALQTFRIGVELFLYQLSIEGIVPKMLTFEGANVDIFIGASAPIAAWLSTRGRIGRRIALAWNYIGLLALANVAVRAVLTAPGPLRRIHTEIPNLMPVTFPYLFIPAFFVPLAAALHVLAIQRGANDDRK